jgi:hypothetical protein
MPRERDTGGPLPAGGQPVAQFLAEEVRRLSEAREELFRCTRGVGLSIPALEELVWLLFDAPYEDVVQVLRDLKGATWPAS